MVLVLFRGAVAPNERAAGDGAAAARACWWIGCIDVGVAVASERAHSVTAVVPSERVV